MHLNNVNDIKRPITEISPIIDTKGDLIIQLIDYYRCLDLDGYEEDEKNESDSDSDNDSDNWYSEEKQKELSYQQPMLIKAFGLFESGKTITVNLYGFEPYFYIKIPDNWKRSECNKLVEHLKQCVYYRYKDHLIDNHIIRAKPFSHFTGDDTFKYLKLIFKNKESFDAYAYKLKNSIKVYGLNNDKPYKYDLYESNIDPIIRFIHLTKILPCGWVRIPKNSFIYVKSHSRSTTTNLEIRVQWDKIKPYDRIVTAPINKMSFDIECDSSHGDFPIAHKTYQKLAQELIKCYSQHGLHSKTSHKHCMFEKSTKNVIGNLLSLAFNDNYLTNNIHHIYTTNNLKPPHDTVEQVTLIILRLFEQLNQKIIDQPQMISQLTDIFEYNFPTIDVSQINGSYYGLLSNEICSQLAHLRSLNNNRLKTNPLEVITMMINLAFDDNFDNFLVSNIYTKQNAKPDKFVLESLVPNVCDILNSSGEFTQNKVMPIDPDGKVVENVTIDYFVDLLAKLFDENLPPIEGDKVIRIGSTFQLVSQPDCYLKHILCLGDCTEINNDEMIVLENKDIYLPYDELAHDLIMYEHIHDQLSEKELKQQISEKAKEIKTWSIDKRKEYCIKAAEYRRSKQSKTDHAKVIVEICHDERELLLKWRELVIMNDPDVVMGYNTFGFDFSFLYDRSVELDCADEFCQLGRIKGFTEKFYEQKLTSAGLGDNNLKYIPITGRIIVDLYKVIQREYRLDSYKLDSVSHKYLYKEKVDLPPKEIFILQKGNADDAKTISSYCLIDCILVNRLDVKLEIVSNCTAMANVCKVPLSYIFLRGQGVKVFSLVADECAGSGFVIPVLPKADPNNKSKYEGAIVLQPIKGIHTDPIAVGDFNSLYPSSMISENISHDSFVEIGGKYDNLPGYTYTDIEYDMYEDTIKPGTKKKIIKKKVGVKKCRYAQLPGDKKSIIPTVLRKLLAARKATKKQMETETDPFKKNLLNGLQLAYKVSANSVYGQTGAKTSPIAKVEIAASTTAVGRSKIMFAKHYAETAYKDKTVTLELEYSGYTDPETKEKLPTKVTGKTVRIKDTVCVYGDTDSIFIKPSVYDVVTNQKLPGKEAIPYVIAIVEQITHEISAQLKPPLNIEFEKAIFPFILISKKRYHGHYYTHIEKDSFYPNSMGIVLKRRDNAPIVKHVFGGAVDIIMNELNIQKASDYVKDECNKILNGQFPLSDFVISKTLKGFYKKPLSIAHNVLAMRQAQRDPGNRFEPNDRVPYAFIPNNNKKSLQGDKIETPEFIEQNNLKVDYRAYITNQIMKPVSQIFELVKGYENFQKNIFINMLDMYENERTGNTSLDQFLTKKSEDSPKIMSLNQMMAEAKNSKTNTETDDDNNSDDDDNDDDDDDDDSDSKNTELEDETQELQSTSNYENPDF